MKKKYNLIIKKSLTQKIKTKKEFISLQIDVSTNLFNQNCFMNIETDDKSLDFTDIILLGILN